MIRHCAFFRFSADLPEADILALLAEFETLVAKCPGFIGIEHGRNISGEGFDHGFVHGIMGDFSNHSALEAYLAHPDHLNLAERLIASLRTSADEDILVFDLVVGLEKTNDQSV